MRTQENAKMLDKINAIIWAVESEASKTPSTLLACTFCSKPFLGILLLQVDPLFFFHHLTSHVHAFDTCKFQCIALE